MKVGDEDANDLPPGEVGLVWLRPPASDRFRYFKDDDKTAGAYRGDYYTLGDMGYVDEDGFLFLTDRSANLIISGGVNIYPAEIDAVLLSHPSVGDAATIGVPDDAWGESVLAIVELQPGVEATPDLADELIAFCRERLARFKCPRAVDFVDHLPRQDNGKVYKRLLRDQYRATGASQGRRGGARVAPPVRGGFRGGRRADVDIDHRQGRPADDPEAELRGRTEGHRRSRRRRPAGAHGRDVRRRRADRPARGPRVAPSQSPAPT
jgi:hypothetical protein